MEAKEACCPAGGLTLSSVQAGEWGPRGPRASEEGPPETARKEDTETLRTRGATWAKAEQDGGGLSLR